VFSKRLVNSIILKFKGTKTYNVNFEPWWREHIVNKISFSVIPIVAYFSQLVSDDIIVGVK